jgi:hypothetical protein
MEIKFIQLTKEELSGIIVDAVRTAMQTNTNEPVYSKPFIKGTHELAEFLGVSTVTAQKLKNEGVFPYFQDGRTVLFDPIKVKIAMEEYQQNRKRTKKVKAK